MSNLPTSEQIRRWTEIHDLLSDLLQHPDKLDAKTDILYKMIWDG